MTPTTKMQIKMKRLALPLAAALVAGVAACTPMKPVTDYRGYLPRAEEIQKVQLGMSKAEVQALLGSPSTTATLESLGESYYYISSVVETTAFLAPKVVDREILAIRFDPEARVNGFGHYGLEDGKIINFSDRQTPTRGKEMNVLQQLFNNVGRFDPSA